MRRIAALLLVIAMSLVPASIPLVNAPSWSSNSNDYSTGGGFWDIDTNGYIDFCMSNGNDMALNQNAVYLNHNGILESTATGVHRTTATSAICTWVTLTTTT